MDFPYSINIQTDDFAHPCKRCGFTNIVKIHYLVNDFITGGGKKYIQYKDETIKELADSVKVQAEIIKTQREIIQKLQDKIDNHNTQRSNSRGYAWG